MEIEVTNLCESPAERERERERERVSERVSAGTKVRPAAGDLSEYTWLMSPIRGDRWDPA